MDMHQTRRLNLFDWIEVNGGAALVASQYRLGKSAQSFLSQLKGGYTFGEKAARNMEARLHLPSGYLDRPRGQVPSAGENVLPFELRTVWPFRTPLEVVLSLPRSARDTIDAYIQGVCDAHLGVKPNGVRL